MLKSNTAYVCLGIASVNAAYLVSHWMGAASAARAVPFFPDVATKTYGLLILVSVGLYVLLDRLFGQGTSKMGLYIFGCFLMTLAALPWHDTGVFGFLLLASLVVLGGAEFLSRSEPAY